MTGTPPSRSNSAATAGWWTKGLSGTRQPRAYTLRTSRPGRPQEVEVVNGHVQDVRVAHGVPEVLGREERPRIAPEGDPDRSQIPELALHNEALHGAKRRVVTVILADHEDTLGSLGYPH